MRCSVLLAASIVFAATSYVADSAESDPGAHLQFDVALQETRFSSKIGSLVPESALPVNASVPLVKVASRLIGSDAWPVSPKLISALQSVSGKLSYAMQALVSTAVLPTPLGFTTVRGLGLQEARHLADAPCSRECTRDVYPNQENFEDCYQCGASNAFESVELGSVEIVFTINYTRLSLLLGGVQSTLSTTCVSLLEEEGMKIKMVGSTFRLLPEAYSMAKFLPLDTISLRYIAWEVLVELQGPNINPFTLEKENLILGLWQLQQAGQDFRIKEADVRGQKKVLLTFVTNHLPTSTGDKLVKIWQGKMPWLAQQLSNRGLKDCRCRLLTAYEVYDETMADQFRVMAGSPRRAPSWWPSVTQWAVGLLVIGIIVQFFWKRQTGLASANFPEMMQYSSGIRGDRHHLIDVPLRSDGHISLCNITISQRRDGSDWLLGKGSSGKVFKGLKNDVQPVAIKLLNQTDAQQLAEFAKEIQLLRTLSFDRNIVQFYGACLQEANTMMVLEYMEGGDLMDAIAADHKNLLRWSRKGSLLALDIAKGLVHLHASQVIHMDLKSKNILLNRDHTVAKITDVGLSRGMASSNKGFTAGTLEYSAPEILLGRFCSEKADIFSYGVILWEIVTHGQPARGGLRDCRCPQECPVEIDSLINKCLHEDPDERPSAKDLCDIVLQWRIGQVGEMREARKSKEEQSLKQAQQSFESQHVPQGDQRKADLHQ
ncbi:hypothetical protein WJX77_005136 [Trebouxia sp. C0004]